MAPPSDRGSQESRRSESGIPPAIPWFWVIPLRRDCNKLGRPFLRLGIYFAFLLTDLGNTRTFHKADGGAVSAFCPNLKFFNGKSCGRHSCHNLLWNTGMALNISRSLWGTHVHYTRITTELWELTALSLPSILVLRSSPLDEQGYHPKRLAPSWRPGRPILARTNKPKQRTLWGSHTFRFIAPLSASPIMGTCFWNLGKLLLI